MIAQFALRLIAGLALTWCLLPRRLVTSGFFRIQSLVALGLSVLGALTAEQRFAPEAAASWFSPAMLRWSFTGLGAASFVGSVLWTLERRRGGALVCFFIAGLSAATLAATQTGFAASPMANLLWIADAFTAAALLGSLMGAMLLGHWYLTATGMSLAPLEHSVRIARWAVALRLLLVVGSVFVADAAIRDASLQTHLVWTLLRWLAGLAGPLLLSALALGTLRYRNTQSATGVLFAGVILAFIGEAAALLLARSLHWPL